MIEQAIKFWGLWLICVLIMEYIRFQNEPKQPFFRRYIFTIVALLVILIQLIMIVMYGKLLEG